MKSFGIGLAILVASAALYIVSYILRKALVQAALVGEAFGASGDLFQLGGINEQLILVSPYICIGIMSFGIGWYWIIAPILYFVRRERDY